MNKIKALIVGTALVAAGAASAVSREGHPQD
jgi:hypothetical protein